MMVQPRRLVMTVVAFTVIVAGCLGPGGPAATGQVSPEGASIPAATPQVFDPFGWPDDVPEACRLLDPRELEEWLGMKTDKGANPFLVTSEQSNVTVPLKNACRWKEPLVGEWTASELVLVIYTRLESDFIGEEWERYPERRLEVHFDHSPGFDRFMSRAWFDPGTSEQPTSITLADGVTVIGARATLYFEVGELWLSLHPSGEAAVRTSVVDETFHLAGIATTRLTGLVDPIGGRE